MDNKKFELNDSDLDIVVGGLGTENNSLGSRSTVRRVCEACKTEREFRVGSGGRGYCTTCNHPQVI